MSNVVATFRGFRIQENNEGSIKSGNTPRNIPSGNEWVPVTHIAYQGGYNPVYGTSIENVIEKIQDQFKRQSQNEARTITRYKKNLSELRSERDEFIEQIKELQEQLNQTCENILYHEERLKDGYGIEA